MSKSKTKNPGEPFDDPGEITHIFKEFVGQSSLDDALFKVCEEDEAYDAPNEVDEAIRTRTRTAELLLEMGANPNYKESTPGPYPLHLACYSRSSELVRILIKHGADVNLKDGMGSNPLVGACQYGNEDIIRILLENGCDINNTDIEGLTPLGRAVFYRKPRSVEVLLEKGCDMEIADNDNQTPIFIACWDGYEEICQKLLEKGCNMEHRDKSGNTPVFGPCLYGHTEILKMLIEKGVDLNVESEDKETLMDYAFHRNKLWGDRICGNIETIEILIRNGVQVPEHLESQKTVKVIKEKLEDEERRRRVCSLIFCARKFSPDSFFSERYLSLDMFKIICLESGITNDLKLKPVLTLKGNVVPLEETVLPLKKRKVE